MSLWYGPDSCTTLVWKHSHAKFCLSLIGPVCRLRILWGNLEAALYLNDFVALCLLSRISHAEFPLTFHTRCAKKGGNGSGCAVLTECDLACCGPMWNRELSLWETVWHWHKRLNTEFPCDLAIAPQTINSRKKIRVCPYKRLHTNIHLTTEGKTEWTLWYVNYLSTKVLQNNGLKKPQRQQHFPPLTTCRELLSERVLIFREIFSVFCACHLASPPSPPTDLCLTLLFCKRQA